MKILLYIDSMAPAGGIERVVAKHISFFAKKYNVTLIVKDGGSSFYDLPENIRLISLKQSASMNMKSRAYRVFQVIKQLFCFRVKLKEHILGYDLFYVSHVRNLFELYLAGIDMSNVVVTEHGSYYGYNGVYKLIKKWLYPKCKYIVSPTTMDYAIYGEMGCRSVYIANPLSFYNDSCSDLRSRIVLNIGRFTSDKRQLLLLQIWSSICLEFPEWKLRLVGTGELEEQLKVFVHDNNLLGYVEFIKPTKNIEEIFLQSSVFAFTSRFEGFGMVLAEAMALGVPCISFDVPSGPRDIIQDGIDGFLVREEQVDEFSEKLRLLMADSEKRQSMGSSAKVNIKKFSDTEIEAQWNKLLDLAEG